MIQCETKHKNQVDDEREGNIVCTDCGLVLEPIYLNTVEYINNNNVPQPKNKTKQIITTSLETLKLCNNLKNESIELDILCNKLQLYAVTKTQIFEKWELIKKWFLEKK